MCREGRVSRAQTCQTCRSRDRDRRMLSRSAPSDFTDSPVFVPQVKQNGVEGGEVVVEGIGHRLECPEGFRLSWKLKASGHGEEL